MNSYKIRSTFLVHEGGTKFYETVVITRSDGRSILVKRYGKSTEVKGGMGKVLYERGNEAEVRVYEQKILNEKRRERPGKGRYVDRTTANGMQSIAEIDSDRELSEMLTGAYPKHVAGSIMEYFDSEYEYLEADEIVDEQPEPEPVIDRGTNWASW